MSVKDFIFFVLAVLGIAICINGQTTEQFLKFFNLWSVDVLPLDQYNYKSTNSCRRCPRIYLPICGDDNKTYTNECKMACYNELRKRDPKVLMLRTGPCKVLPE